MRLDVHNLKKSFGEKEILHGISFHAESGRALGLLGRNGAGKTTTIRILMDVFKANSGEITLDGKPFEAGKVQIGYLPEERGLYPKKKVGEQILYLAQLRGMHKPLAKKQMLYWLRKLEVDEYIDKRLDTLSKGNQQKVQLAQTLVCNPELVILDEPFSGLDPVNSQILKNVIMELISQGKLVIFSSHQMSYVEEFCEDIVILNHGDVVLEGNLRDIKREFGENLLSVASVDHIPSELAGILKEEFHDVVSVETIRKDKVLVRLQDGTEKAELLGKLLDYGIDLEFFGLYEASLTDIFVEKAGEQE